MELKIRDKVAIVTGASKGMGLAVAKAFIEEGVKVLLVARDEQLLVALLNDFRAAGAEVDYLAGDVADLTLPGRVVEKAVSLWGSIDILINNAGGPPPGSFLEHELSAWESAIETNLMSVVRFSKAVAPLMKDQNWGRIISITSTIAKEPSPTMVLSATVRSGVSAFTKAISTELAPFNITANVVCPGGVLTDRLSGLLKIRAEKENRDFDELLTESQHTIPAQRFASPTEIANTILLLASESGSYITGVSLSVDGGLTKSF
jgi:3-oxoacyl-[acyl-carrier protein] reductase